MAHRDRTRDFVEIRLKIRRDSFGRSVSAEPVEGSDRSIGWMETVHDIEYDIGQVERMSVYPLSCSLKDSNAWGL